jgi:hypothetical protein
MPFHDGSKTIFFDVGFIKTKHISGFVSHPPKLIDFNVLSP